MIRKFWDSVWGRALSTVVLLAAGFVFFEWMDCRRDRRILEERIEADKRFLDSLIKVSGKGPESETESETVNDSKTTVESHVLTTDDQQQTDAIEPEQITDKAELERTRPSH